MCGWIATYEANVKGEESPITGVLEFEAVGILGAFGELEDRLVPQELIKLKSQGYDVSSLSIKSCFKQL